MWAASRPKPYSLRAVIMFGAVGLTMGAMADPMTPTKVQTLRMLSQPDDDHGDAPALPAKSGRLHILTVRPKLPDEHSDASGRELSTAEGRGNASPDADTHVVRTTPVRPQPSEHHNAPIRERQDTQGIINGASDPRFVRTTPVRSEPSGTGEPYSHFVPATSAPTRSAPQ
jgi:hypothetical protein